MAVTISKEGKMQKITDEYLPAFLGFAINKIGNIREAEELAEEIAFQSILAVERDKISDNFDAYIWSIAHNTFKRWCLCRQNKFVSLDDEPDTFSNILSDEVPLLEQVIRKEEKDAVRFALSHLSSDYRKTIVCFYYDELSIRDIGKKLSFSEGMVKFYLRAGRQKLKEAYDMSQIGEKSYNPSDFSIYKSGINFSKVNVWDVFKRRMPCQIAIICHDNAKTVGEISVETGTPAVYIEDEIKLLLDAGVMVSPVKDKYRTNFHILKERAALQLQEQFRKCFDAYAPYVIKAYEKYLPELKKCDVFRLDATDNQWAWYFSNNIPDFDYDGYQLASEDYPQILSCGSRSIIFAETAKGSIWAAGQTPTFLEKCNVHPCDVVAFGEYHRQRELRDKRKAQALYDVYCGIVKDEDKELYAELIEQGYVVKRGDTLYCNVAVTTVKCRRLFDSICGELRPVLRELCASIRENISRIVKATIPKQLSSYTRGYTETWISFYAGVYLHEALYDKDFIGIPEKDDLTPVACWIYEK